MYKIQTLNNISVRGLERLPRDAYEIASDITAPDAIMVRSFKMHDMSLPDSVKAIGRAGAGTNNIPVPAMSKRGVVVFNAPGANANAVKELVIAGMLLASRNIHQALRFVDQLEGDDASVSKMVEDGKKKYVGIELPGRSLGVIGLGAIGVRVANSALDLGMQVIGFDPAMTVDNAWRLSAGVKQAVSVDDVLSRSQFVSLHVPLIDATRGLINADRIKLMPKGSVVLNFSRAEIVDEPAVLAALESGHLRAYVCDFPSNRLKGNGKVIALPHLGASTGEAEENCAVMVAEQLKDFLENGNVRNSVNFPEAILPKGAGDHRLCIANANVPNMVGQITTELAKHQLNITDLLNKSRGEIAYTLVDVDSEVPAEIVETLRKIDGVLSVRLIPAAG
jgi:D-3-phosphoglycerate dehydrogenase